MDLALPTKPSVAVLTRRAHWRAQQTVGGYGKLAQQHQTDSVSGSWVSAAGALGLSSAPCGDAAVKLSWLWPAGVVHQPLCGKAGWANRSADSSLGQATRV